MAGKQDRERSGTRDDAGAAPRDGGADRPGSTGGTGGATGSPDRAPGGETDENAADTDERDYGDSAGYGHGGSTLDYRDVVGDDGTDARPNPLDEVLDPKDRPDRGSRSRKPGG